MASKNTQTLLNQEQPVSPKQEEPTAVQKANSDLLTAEKKRKLLLQTYREEEKVQMYLSPMYKPYFGNVMTVSINGISIFFKVDGSTQTIPKTFADEIASRRIAIDAMLNKQNRMADVANNNEKSPGELALF
jgi:hypothetical protein